MTRRERLEARQARLEAWAAKRQAKADAVFAAREENRCHAFNTQPGHVPGRAREIARTDRALQDSAMAEQHERKAKRVAARLDNTIFSDDENAISELEARIARREEYCALAKKVNAVWRKLKGSPGDLATKLVADGICSQANADSIAETMRQCPWLSKPVDTTNERASIRRDRDRIQQIKGRQS